MKFNIFEALRKDHDRQRALLKTVLDTNGDSSLRESSFQSLKIQLTEHAKFEERNFYKPLIDFDLTQVKSRHSISEHKDIDDLIHALDETSKSSSAWLKKAKELEHKVLHHLEEEEREVFQLAGRVLTENQKIDLAKIYENNIKETKARPNDL